MTRRIILLAAAFAALPGAAAPAPAVRTIIVDRMQFGPAPALLRRGDVLLWVNRDFVRHSATATDRSFDVDLPAHGSAKIVLRRAGTIAFSCKFHPAMKGRLTVR
jgi:plastocyanin